MIEKLKKNPYGIAVGIVLLLALFLRIYQLDAISLWVDEFIHSLSAKDIVTGNTARNKEGVFLTWTISVFYTIFGISDFTTRLPSALFGSFSVILVYLIGKKLFNKEVALIACFVAAYSLFLVFWGRIARNYASFEFFFLLMVYGYLKLMENEPKKDGNLFVKMGIKPIYLALFLPALAISFLNHTLTAFFFFGLAFYCVGVAILLFKNRTENPAEFYKYLVIGSIGIVGILFFLLPFTNSLSKPFLLIFLPERAVNWIIPNWEYLGKQCAEKPYEIFNLYKAVFTTDFSFTFYVGLIGFVIAFLVKKKGAIFIAALFIISFLLQSFIFRNPALPRYILYVHPFFILSISAAFYFVLNFVFTKVKQLENWNLKSNGLVLVGVAVLSIFLLSSSTRSFQLAANTEHGQVVPKALSQWYFTNWRVPTDYINKNRQPNDLIISTMASSAEHYFGLEPNEAVFFRQNFYDTEAKQYRPYEKDPLTENSARSLENLQVTVQNNDRGWLLADYYFYNVMTDPKVRNWVFNNMYYHPQATLDGGVKVFSWDNSKPKVNYQTIVLDLGKSKQYIASQEMAVNIQKGNIPPSLIVHAQYLDSNLEGYVVVNRSKSIGLPPNNGNKIEKLKIPLSNEYLQNGQNSIQFVYNEKNAFDPNKGFVIYHVGIE